MHDARTPIRLSVLIAWLLGCLSVMQMGGQQAVSYLDTDAPVEARITDLLGKMTLAEKIDALGANPSIARLGLTLPRDVEGLHGLAISGPANWARVYRDTQPTTQFPQARGLGQTWDPALVREVAAVEGYEVRYLYNTRHRGGLIVRAPNADLSRDPRWGRSEESYGEDPFLVGTFATAFVEGLQGADPRRWQAAAMLKHFVANSNEDARKTSSSDFDERLLHEYYGVPFRMAIEDGHANAIMAAYNEWNGVPMAVNPALRDVVEGQWGLNGIVSADAGALVDLVMTQHVAKTQPEAIAAALHAGVNHFLDDYATTLRQAIALKLVSEQDLDASLRGVYRVFLKLGVIDPPSSAGAAQDEYRAIGVNDGAPAAGQVGPPWDWQQNRALARRATDESIVLLKNSVVPETKAALLPLDSARLKSIAVIGPTADKVLLDWYSGTPTSSVTPLQGIEARAGAGVSVGFARGDDLMAASELARRSDVAIVVIGNNPTCGAPWGFCPVPSDGKEALDRHSLMLRQEEIAKAVLAVNPRTIVVLQASFPFTTTWSEANVPAILAMTHGSEEQGTGLADVLFGDYNPAGRLTQTWVRSIDDLPPMMDYDIRHGRTYLYAKQKPLYAFGFGLSYTEFAYSNLRLDTGMLNKTGRTDVQVDVTNTGSRDGDEVVQLYVAHRGSSVERPAEELKSFRRVPLKAGETKTVSIPLDRGALAYWNQGRHRFEVERDTVELRVGGSSDNLPLRTTLAITK